MADPKNTKTQVNNAKDLDVDAKKEEPSFFGSFFAPKAGGPKKKGAAVMDTPPPSIRPQNALNERETMETEVISCVISIYTDLSVRNITPHNIFSNRTAYSFLLQHRQTGDD